MKSNALFLIMLSSLCYSIHYVLFQIAMDSSSYNSTINYFEISLILIGVFYSYLNDIVLIFHIQ